MGNSLLCSILHTVIKMRQRMNGFFNVLKGNLGCQGLKGDTVGSLLTGVLELQMVSGQYLVMKMTVGTGTEGVGKLSMYYVIFLFFIFLC